MKSLQNWFDEYAECHQNETNKAIHWVCIPSIYYSIVGLLVSIPFPFSTTNFPESLQPFVNWAGVALMAAMLFYFILSFTMALGMLFFSIVCLYVAHFISQFSVSLWVSSLIIFTLAWIGQFYGHKIEGKKPSFFNDVQFLLIGPAWLMGFIYKKIGVRY